MIEAYNRQYGTCYTSLIPATLYGPNDNFDSDTSHVLSALVARIHNAKASSQDSVVIWGTGTPRREFLYVDDLADACMFLMSLTDEQLKQSFESTGWVLNAGCGEDLTISELALAIKRAVGFTGEILTDPSRPDGAPRKLLDSRRITELGWTPNITLEEGIAKTYAWYQKSGIKTPV
jgi:nucleoside-diphosphate-sugar epimerase